MKAITLTQPFASLVACGAKKIETRNWQVSYRGPLAIHAAKGFPWEYHQLCFTEPFLSALGLPPLGLVMLQKLLPLGAVVATCELVNVVPVRDKQTLWPRVDQRGVKMDSFFPDNVWIPPKEPELSFGDYTPGRFAWLLANVTPLPVPAPARGQQGLWEWEIPEGMAEQFIIEGRPEWVENKLLGGGK